jgi:hypothetical protein
MGEKDSESNATGEDVYLHLPGVASVRWDASIHAVVETWEGWANSDEFRAILDAGVRAMSQNRGSRWLADCRLQRVLKAADQEAGNTWWLPRALAAGLKRFAVVLPASGLAKANIQDHLRAAASKELDMAYFATLEEARQWLVQA